MTVEQSVRRLARGEIIGSRRRVDLGAASLSIADAHQRVTPHTHSDAHFVYLIRGAYRSDAAREGGLLGDGQAIFNPPGTTHADCFVDRGRLFAVSLSDDLYRNASAFAPERGPSVLVTDPQATSLLRQIFAEALRPGPASTLNIESLAMELVAGVGRAVAGVARRYPPWLARVRDRLRDECMASHSIGDLARAEGVHPVYLARAFRRFHGCSPGDFQRRRRLELASDLLATTGFPLSEIAIASGFADQSHFTRSFSSAMGIAPAAFRRRFTSPRFHQGKTASPAAD